MLMPTMLDEYEQAPAGVPRTVMCIIEHSLVVRL